MSNLFNLSEPCEANNFASEYVKLIADNFQKHGYSLIDGYDDASEMARAIWHAPFVVLSHDTSEPPIFVYGNLCSLQLFEMDWQQLTNCHSHKSAEPKEREERAKLLQEVREKGIINHYSGTRISANGRRFWIDNATICNLLDGERYVGQAVVFKQWQFLDESG